MSSAIQRETPSQQRAQARLDKIMSVAKSLMVEVGFDEINIPGASPSASWNSLRERGIKVRTWLIDDHYATAHKSCLDL